MSEQLKEALSAVIDGEASEFELRRVLNEVIKDDRLFREWRSYYLIRNAVKRQNTQDVQLMNDRIWAALDADEFLEQDIVQTEMQPLVDVDLTRPRPRWAAITGGAVAAGLALALLVGSNIGDPGGSVDTAPQVAESGEPQPAAAPDLGLPRNPVAPTVQPDGLLAVSDGSFNYGPGFVPTNRLSAADRARNEGYFMHHVQHRGVNEGSLLPFVKMIAYEQ